jgi:Family of unknown function (DUF6086)
MSYVFDEPAGSTIWSPATTTGQLFVEVSTTVRRIVGTPSFLTAMAADWYEVDPHGLHDATTQLVDRISGNVALMEIAHGFVTVSLVLMDRCGLDSASIVGRHADQYEWRGLARHMPQM